MPDDRRFMHGVSLLKVGSQFLVMFSSHYYPPIDPDLGEEPWMHNVFYSWLNPASPQLNVQQLFDRYEAQEPTSAAINSNSNIFVTTEDGFDGIHQYAGIWSSGLVNIIPFTNIFVREGGHSGHVAAASQRYAVAYSEGWVDGGGYENLGTGADVWVRFIEENGNMGPELAIAQGRNWWPVIDAWWDIAQVAWMEYTGATTFPKLKTARVTAAGTVSNVQDVVQLTEYYNYDIRWMPLIAKFLILGSNTTNAYAVLVNENGSIAYQNLTLPNKTIREARFAVNENTVVYPIAPTGLCVLDVTANSVSVRKTIPGGVTWSYIGTDGIFLDEDRVLFAGATPTGLKLQLATGLAPVVEPPPDPDPDPDPPPQALRRYHGAIPYSLKIKITPPEQQP